MHPRDHVHSASMSSGAANIAPWSRYDTGQLFKIIGDVIRELSKRFIKGDDKPTIDFFVITHYNSNEYKPIIRDLEAFEELGLHLVGDRDWKDYQYNLRPIFSLLESKIKWGEEKMEYSSFRRAVSRYLDATGKEAQDSKKQIQHRKAGLKVMFDQYHVIY